MRRIGKRRERMRRIGKRRERRRIGKRRERRRIGKRRERRWRIGMRRGEGKEKQEAEEEDEVTNDITTVYVDRNDKDRSYITLYLSF